MILKITINRIKKWSKDGNLKKLIDALENKDPEIRKAAALCIGASGDRAAIDYIKYVYHNEPDLFVKQDVIRSLERLEKSSYNSSIHINLSYEHPSYTIIPNSQGA